jgi:hypothetical protein
MIEISWRKMEKKEKKEIETALIEFFRTDEYLQEDVGYNTENIEFKFYTIRRGFRTNDPNISGHGDDRVIMDEITLPKIKKIITTIAPKFVVKPVKR